MKAIKLPLLYTVFTMLALTIASCEDTSFSKTGLEFLESAFGYSDHTAKSLLSDDISIDWYSDDLSTSEKKDKIISELKAFKDEYKITSDCKYRSGYTYQVWGDDYATGFYSLGSNTEYLIVFGFEKNSYEEWRIEGIELAKIKELNEEYKIEKERLAKYIEEGDKDKIKEQKLYVKRAENLIKSVTDLMPESQIQEFKKIKSGRI